MERPSAIVTELARLENTDPCESDVAMHTDPCGQPADWVVTFRLLGVFRDVAPQRVLLCSRHTQDWTQHIAECRHCGDLVQLTVEPHERKAARR